jgi:tetratricopeptide (TPR) repeat protein
MVRFRIPIGLKCKICDNIAVYDCKAMNAKICRLCCDRYQISNKSIDKCLKCDYLFRDVGYEVKINMGMVLFYEYKNKFIFDNERESYHLKVIELYKRLGVNTDNEIFNLAVQYYYAGKAQESLDLYNNINKNNISNKDKVDLYEKIGDALTSLKRITEAKNAYIKSLDYGNITPQIYRRLGEVYNSLKEYSQSIYYHEKSLNTYFFKEWRNEDDWNKSYDFMYFTNYCSLATIYSEFNNYDKVIENANAFIDYYGDFEYIKERFFMEGTIDGDCFMPELIVSMYKLISLTYISLKDYSQAKDNIEKARILSQNDIELAKIEGFVEGKLDSNDMTFEVERLRQELVEKTNTIMILIKNTRNETIINYNFNSDGGDIYMESKYKIENSGTIGNQVFGDNVTFHNETLSDNDILFKEISVILSEISEKISIIGNKDSQKHINNINESIKNKKITGLKNQLSNLLVGVTSGCIANNMPHILTKISELISKF